jgi:hypothetical protein
MIVRSAWHLKIRLGVKRILPMQYHGTRCKTTRTPYWVRENELQVGAWTVTFAWPSKSAYRRALVRPSKAQVIVYTIVEPLFKLVGTCHVRARQVSGRRRAHSAGPA